MVWLLWTIAWNRTEFCSVCSRTALLAHEPEETNPPYSEAVVCCTVPHAGATPAGEGPAFLRGFRKPLLGTLVWSTSSLVQQGSLLFSHLAMMSARGRVPGSCHGRRAISHHAPGWTLVGNEMNPPWSDPAGRFFCSFLSWILRNRTPISKGSIPHDARGWGQWRGK